MGDGPFLSEPVNEVYEHSSVSVTAPAGDGDIEIDEEEDEDDDIIYGKQARPYHTWGQDKVYMYTKPFQKIILLNMHVFRKKPVIIRAPRYS